MHGMAAVQAIAAAGMAVREPVGAAGFAAQAAGASATEHPELSKLPSPAREGGVRQAPRAQGTARLWLLPSGSDQVHAVPLLGTRRTPPSRAGLAELRNGGEGGIRTPGNLLGCTRFPSELLKPLGHLSVPRLLAGEAPGRWIGAILLPQLPYRTQPFAEVV